MKKYTEAKKSSSRRFCKPHRMMLVESDIKYGLKLPAGKNGTLVQTYLVVIIDNHSRYVLEARWYDHQRESIVEDCYHRAILKHGKISAAYHDNGKQFVSRQLIQSLSMLGTRILRAKPYSPQSKGGVEVFNRFVNAFLAEASAQKIRTLDDLNRFWDIWLEEYYHNKPHEGIAEYYKSLGSPVKAKGSARFRNGTAIPILLYFWMQAWLGMHSYITRNARWTKAAASVSEDTCMKPAPH